MAAAGGERPAVRKSTRLHSRQHLLRREEEKEEEAEKRRGGQREQGGGKTNTAEGKYMYTLYRSSVGM